MKLIPSKRLLKEQNPEVKKLNGSQAVTYLPNRNLVEEFRSEVDRDSTAMTSEEAVRRISRGGRGAA